MAATSLPLRTNSETVDIMKIMKGKNDIRQVFEKRVVSRWKWEHHVVNGTIKPTKKLLPPPPHNLTISKGLAYNTYSREFLEWVMGDTRARDLLRWSEKTYSPDEHYWSTLNDLYHNPGLASPGGFKGHPDKKGYFCMVVFWNSKNKCWGRNVHNICLLGTGDLANVTRSTSLAANKFDLQYDPVAYSCMEEWIENRTRDPRSWSSLNLKYYRQRYFVWYDPDSQAAKEKRIQNKEEKSGRRGGKRDKMAAVIIATTVSGQHTVVGEEKDKVLKEVRDTKKAAADGLLEHNETINYKTQMTKPFVSTGTNHDNNDNDRVKLAATRNRNQSGTADELHKVEKPTRSRKIQMGL